MSRIHRRLVATPALLLVATGLVAATPASAVPDPAPLTVAGPTPRATAKTRIVIRSDDCEGCAITASWGRALKRAPWYVSRQWHATVTDGKAVFTIPTRKTSPLYFLVGEETIPGVTGSFGAAPVVVVRYQGLRPGQVVAPDKAAASRRATGCWAGTKRTRARFNLQVDHFRARDAYSEEMTTMARLYFSPGKATVGKLKPAPRGTSGTQDVAYCLD